MLVRRGFVVLAPAAIAAVSASCSSHGCTAIGTICDRTVLTLQTPDDTWAAGDYTLSLDVDGVAKQCTLHIPDPPVDGVTSGTCTSSDASLRLLQICPEPKVVCNASACMGSSDSEDCLSGLYTMQVDLSPSFGPVVQPRLASEVAVDLSVDGRSILSARVSPQATTTEPNGAGCGTCTNGSATITGS